MIVHAQQNAQFTAIPKAVGRALKICVEELIPNKAVCLCFKFCLREGFGGWVSLACAFRSMYTAALLKLHPDIAVTACFKGNFFFLLSF